jgi:hypothetical protein
MDDEVLRLRRLRATALRVRAFARALAADASNDHAMFSRTACSCWRIARTATGRLRSHPHLRYQRDAGSLAAMWYDAVARLLVGRGGSRADMLGELQANLRVISRELADARAMTWSPDLSDSLGRSQVEVRRLIDAVERAVLAQAPVGVARNPQAAGSSAANRSPADGTAQWPYLAG